MQVNLYPAWCFFDTFTRVIWAPAFHEAKSKNTEPPKIIDAHAHADLRYQGARPYTSRNGCGLSGCGGLGSVSLLFDLSVALT